MFKWWVAALRLVLLFLLLVNIIITIIIIIILITTIIRITSIMLFLFGRCWQGHPLGQPSVTEGPEAGFTRPY